MDRNFNQAVDINGDLTIDGDLTVSGNMNGNIIANELTETAIATLINLFLPVGTYLENENASFNPNTLYPGTTWVAESGYFHFSAGTAANPVYLLTEDTTFQSGKTYYTLSGGTYTAATVTVGNAVTANTYYERITGGKTGGEATHTLTVEEMPEHFHKRIIDEDTGGYVGRGHDSDNTEVGFRVEGAITSASSDQVGGYFITSNTGGSLPHNNIPPYIAVYRWKRTA